MSTNFIAPSSYVKAIAEAKTRRDEYEARESALKKQSDDCSEFFRALGVSLSAEMNKANEGLRESSFKELFEGLFAARAPEHQMLISFGGSQNARDITLDLSDKNYPTIRIKDLNNSPTGSLQFVLKNVGKGMQAFVTEGGGTANWSIPLSVDQVAARVVENVIDDLYR
ncbi:MAG TPA: hypothetical protein VFU55_06670 [Terracidiphilus sp.]|nr:hypothetical protein [Terracidiphilus sp.]